MEKNNNNPNNNNNNNNNRLLCEACDGLKKENDYILSFCPKMVVQEEDQDDRSSGNQHEPSRKKRRRRNKDKIRFSTYGKCVEYCMECFKKNVSGCSVCGDQDTCPFCLLTEPSGHYTDDVVAGARGSDIHAILGGSGDAGTITMSFEDDNKQKATTRRRDEGQGETTLPAAAGDKNDSKISHSSPQHDGQRTRRPIVFSKDLICQNCDQESFSPLFGNDFSALRIQKRRERNMRRSLRCLNADKEYVMSRVLPKIKTRTLRKVVQNWLDWTSSYDDSSVNDIAENHTTTTNSTSTIHEGKQDPGQAQQAIVVQGAGPTDQYHHQFSSSSLSFSSSYQNQQPTTRLERKRKNEGVGKNVNDE